jgi:response regulator RpfG family c-di-GMP phosphodiesterase
MANKICILYVDDELNNLVSFKAVFRIKYNVLTAISGEEAINVL